MRPELRQALAETRFEVIDGEWFYAKLPPDAEAIEDAFAVMRDADECTCVARQEAFVCFDCPLEGPLALICLKVTVPFQVVGFLAVIGGVLADAGLNILFLCSFSRDYLLVRSENLGVATSALESLGLVKAV